MKRANDEDDVAPNEAEAPIPKRHEKEKDATAAVEEPPSKSVAIPRGSNTMVRANSSPEVLIAKGSLLSCSGHLGNGWRMGRARFGSGSSGCYFEVTRTSETGNVRVGWATAEGNYDANVGYDRFSFGYRDVDGSVVHNSRVMHCGLAPWTTGDVIGCLLWQPDPETPGQILFFKNGLPQGVAFANVPTAVYFPAVSLHGGATASVNLGPRFAHSPQLPFEWCGAHALDRPLSEFGSRAKKGRIGEAKSNSSAASAATASAAPAVAVAEKAKAEELARRLSISEGSVPVPRITADNLLESFPNTSFWVEPKEEVSNS